MSAGSHELVWEFAYQQPQCGNPPDCTEVEFVAMTTGDTLTFDVAEGDEVLAVAFLNFEFTGQEIIAVPTQHAEVLTAPQPDNRGLFLVHGGSNGQNGPVDVRVYGSPDGQTQEYVQGQAPLGGTGTSMLSVPYGSIDQLGIARSGGDSYTMYNHPTIADGDVRYAVFRSSNNAPWVPLESGSGGQQLSGF